PWGAKGIAVAWVVSFWVLTIPALWYAGRPAHLEIASVVAVVWKYVVASALAGGASAVIIRGTPSFVAASAGSEAGEAGGRVLATPLVFGGLYLGAVIMLHRGCAPLHHVAGLLRDIVPWAASQARTARERSGSRVIA